VGQEDMMMIVIVSSLINVELSLIIVSFIVLITDSLWGYSWTVF
jgi:hypothetical protein